LLSLLGLPFVIQAARVDEEPQDGEPPAEMVLRVAQAKALSATGIRPDDLVVAADTTVALDGRSLGKPADAADAERMLRELRGRSHTVYTGVVIYHLATRRMVCELGESNVWMRQYADAEIGQYVESGDPLDKAGAYAIQHPGFDPVARVEGCWLNVMGLPLCHLARALAVFGLVAPALVPSSCRAFSQRECDVGAVILAASAGVGASMRAQATACCTR
jgi:septum formation protein